MVRIKDLVEKYGNREIDEDELEKLLKPDKKTIYDLKKGDSYYSITTNGSIIRLYWSDDIFNTQRFSMGNVFLIEEEVENELEYRKIRTELKRYASMCDEPLDWDNKEQKKYYIQYSHTDREVDTTFEWSWSTCDIYFTDEDILKQAIKEIGEDRIIKYYFGVKEESK